MLCKAFCRGAIPPKNVLTASVLPDRVNVKRRALFFAAGLPTDRQVCEGGTTSACTHLDVYTHCRLAEFVLCDSPFSCDGDSKNSKVWQGRIESACARTHACAHCHDAGIGPGPCLAWQIDGPIVNPSSCAVGCLSISRVDAS